jgi:hypothetical protein
MKRMQWGILTVVLIVSFAGVAPANAQQQICAFQDDVTEYYSGYDDSPFRYVAPYIDDKVSFSVVKVTGDVKRVEVFFGETKIGNVPLDGTPLNYAVAPDAPFETDFTIKVTGEGFSWVDLHIVYTGWCLYGNPGIQDPPNLILVLSDTPFLDAPDGKSIKQWLHACQTVFIIEISKDGGFGRVSGFGNSDHWIDMHRTADVAEDYGQPGGQAIWPGCPGH